MVKLWRTFVCTESVQQHDWRPNPGRRLPSGKAKNAKRGIVRSIGRFDTAERRVDSRTQAG